MALGSPSEFDFSCAIVSPSADHRKWNERPSWASHSNLSMERKTQLGESQQPVQDLYERCQVRLRVEIRNFCRRLECDRFRRLRMRGRFGRLSSERWVPFRMDTGYVRRGDYDISRR